MVAIPTIWVGYNLYYEEGHLTVCNAAPYPVTFVASYKRLPKITYSSDYSETLEAGQCSTRSTLFKGTDANFLVYAESVENHKRLKWAYSPHISAGDKVVWPFHEKNVSEKRRFRSNGRVRTEGFAKTLKTESSLGESRWRYFIFDANFNVLPTTPRRCGPSCISTSLQRAKELAFAMDAQIFFDEKWKRRHFRYYISSKMSDHNGAFNLGFRVTGVPRSTVYGDHNPLKDNDVIVAINGIPVFAPEDFQMRLEYFGESRQHGITKPIVLEVARPGHTKIMRVKTHYFFNYHHWGYSADDKFNTVLLGITDAVSLGKTAFTWCAGSDGLSFLRNIISRATEFAAREFFQEKINLGRSKDIDQDQCRWKMEQTIARYKQYNNKLYNNSAWLTVVTPNALRLVSSKAFSKWTTRKLGSKTVGRTVSNIGLEAVETALWTINGSSPLSSTKNIWRDVKTAVPVAVGLSTALGVGSSILFKRTKKTTSGSAVRGSPQNSAKPEKRNQSKPDKKRSGDPKINKKPLKRIAPQGIKL